MDKTKKCKYCKTEIDSKAKVCPNCKRKQGGIFKWVVITIIILAVLGQIFGEKEEPQLVETVSNQETDESLTQTDAKSENLDATIVKEDSESEKTEIEKNSFKVGETASLKNIEVTLSQVTETAGSEYNKPSDGKIFILCEFLVVNNSDSDITVSSALSFEAYVDDFSINQSLLALLENTDFKTLDGNVAVGKKMIGYIGYEVPTNWQELEISFTPNFWAGKDIKFLVTKVSK